MQSRQAVTVWALGLCLLGWLPATFAFGLGSLQVNSTLGEPLDARITLFSVSQSEQQSLRARLGDAQLYTEHDVKRPAVIDTIDVAVQKGAAVGGGVQLHLTSKQPISAPLLELLVVADAADGRVVRKYTALLYPTMASGSTPAPKAAASGPKITYQPRGKTVTVAPKQTLWSISKNNKYPGVSIEQMLVAIYRANPSAFDGSINSMKKGSTLVMPSLDEVEKIDAAWAENWVESRT